MVSLHSQLMFTSSWDFCVLVFLFQRKRSAVSTVKEEAKDILEQGEHLLEEAYQLSDNINKEVEVQQYMFTSGVTPIKPVLFFSRPSMPSYQHSKQSFCFCLQELEEMETELGPLGDRLEDRVSHLTDGLGNGRLANHVLEAEDHAKQLNQSAAILDRYT